MSKLQSTKSKATHRQLKARGLSPKKVSEQNRKARIKILVEGANTAEMLVNTTLLMNHFHEMDGFDIEFIKKIRGLTTAITPPQKQRILELMDKFGVKVEENCLHQKPISPLRKEHSPGKKLLKFSEFDKSQELSRLNAILKRKDMKPQEIEIQLTNYSNEIDKFIITANEQIKTNQCDKLTQRCVVLGLIKAHKKSQRSEQGKPSNKSRTSKLPFRRYKGAVNAILNHQKVHHLLSCRELYLCQEILKMGENMTENQIYTFKGVLLKYRLYFHERTFKAFDLGDWPLEKS